MAAAADQAMDAVVKVYCVHMPPDFSLPWQQSHALNSNSSGFIISGRRVITNAHCVLHHTQVKLRKRGSHTKYQATVLSVGTDCDLAMLTVGDEEFWEGVTPVSFGDLPRLQDAVCVAGYPMCGDTISTTIGVVSRVEVMPYGQGSLKLLAVQIDAAINPGNSGGPVFNAQHQCVGVAFQGYAREDAQRIGEVIPTPVIAHFITDYERSGRYTGFPSLGIHSIQRMENADLRIASGMKPRQMGIRVAIVEPTSPAARSLRASDVLLSVDGIEVSNDGTVPFRRGERVGYSYLVSQKFAGESCKLSILRDSTLIELDVEVALVKPLVPLYSREGPPEYYVIGGLVFSVLSLDYLRHEYGKDYRRSASDKLVDKMQNWTAQTEGEQLVLISQVLAADINVGYEHIANIQVESFNGVRVHNLRHLAQMVENCTEKFLRFDLDNKKILVLETEAAKEATPGILETHGIPARMSHNLIGADNSE